MTRMSLSFTTVCPQGLGARLPAQWGPDLLNAEINRAPLIIEGLHMDLLVEENKVCGWRPPGVAPALPTAPARSPPHPPVPAQVKLFRREHRIGRLPRPPANGYPHFLSASSPAHILGLGIGPEVLRRNSATELHPSHPSLSPSSLLHFSLGSVAKLKPGSRSACLCLPSAGPKGVLHRAWLVHPFNIHAKHAFCVCKVL